MVSDLGVWNTPLEPAPRLAERLGLGRDDLWIKRDDWLGFGGGANKLRKLEHLIGAAVAAGATTLVTTGAAQSNYARLTAASARRLGLDVVLVLHSGSGTGNLTLDAVFGAEGIRMRLDQVGPGYELLTDARARRSRPRAAARA